MKRFLEVFTRNWPLKLLAFALALVIFYVVRDSIHSARPLYETPSFMKGTVDANAGN